MIFLILQIIINITFINLFVPNILLISRNPIDFLDFEERLQLININYIEPVTNVNLMDQQASKTFQKHQKSF